MDVSKNTRPTVNMSISYREAHIMLEALGHLTDETLTDAPASTRADAERMRDELAAAL